MNLLRGNRLACRDTKTEIQVGQLPVVQEVGLKVESEPTVICSLEEDSFCAGRTEI